MSLRRQAEKAAADVATWPQWMRNAVKPNGGRMSKRWTAQPSVYGTTNAVSVKDLRGVRHREVHRDDSVIISGAEYLRKTWAEVELDRIRMSIADLPKGRMDDDS